jgi:hypothetical protein
MDQLHQEFEAEKARLQELFNEELANYVCRLIKEKAPTATGGRPPPKQGLFKPSWQTSASHVYDRLFGPDRA